MDAQQQAAADAAAAAAAAQQAQLAQPHAQQQQQQPQGQGIVPPRHVRELRLNAPVPFSGDRSKLRTFTQSCNLYLATNTNAYDDANKQVAYVLSNIIGGEAEAWKEQFLANAERLAVEDAAANPG